MKNESVKLLFIPVSGPRGMGEYARSVAIAKAVTSRWPGTQIHFVLSRLAPYAVDTPFPFTLLPSSPTFHRKEVSEIITEFQPTVVIFDNAGRTTQLRVASRSGAHVVYVSSRRRQRHKAFRWRWMGLINEHWIAYPEFIAGALTPLERLKLWMRNGPRVRFLDTILPMHDPASASAVMAHFNVQPGQYVLVVPGGGTGHPGAENAPDVFATAARGIAQRGYQTVLVGAATDKSSEHIANLHMTPRMPMEQLCELIRGARLVVSNGGDTLLQVLGCQRPCIAVPIAHDQNRRVERCVDRGMVASAKLDARDIENASMTLLERGSRHAELKARHGENSPNVGKITNAMDVVLDALAAFREHGKN